jgi:hypothetical protein
MRRIKSRAARLVERVSYAFAYAKSIALQGESRRIGGMSLSIRPATVTDIPLILEFIRGLSEFEKLLHEVEATPERLAATLSRPPVRRPRNAGWRLKMTSPPASQFSSPAIPRFSASPACISKTCS